MNGPTQQRWNQILRQITENGSVLEASVLPDTPDHAADACDYLLMTLASAYVLMARADPDYPEFMPYVNHVFLFGAPNPDATYYWAPLCDRGTYRIVGYRNSVGWVDFMTGRDFGGFSEEPGPSFGSTQIDQMQVAADGRFEVLLSAEKPAGYDGNWIKLEPTTNYLVIRQFAYAADEADVRMGIERLDPVPPRRVDRAVVDKRIEETLRYLRNASQCWPSYLRRQRLAEDGYVNRFRVANYGGTGEVYGQIYHQARYEVDEDEALLIEVRVPRQCRYWNIQLSDLLWRTLEHMNRQSSLNGHVDRADGDGVTRLVIAHRDPGVANWVDACGVSRGDMIMRWLYVDAEPAIAVTRVKFAELGSRLPPDTKRVSPDDRQRALRERAMAMQLRRRW